MYALTDKGNANLKAAGTSLSAEELQVLILIDGQATVAQVAAAARNVTPLKSNEIMRKFFADRIITTATEPSSDGLESGFFSIAVPAGFFSSLSKESSAEAEQGVTSLNQKGYYARISQRLAAARVLKEGEQITVLVVDDDPDLLKLLRTYLKMEGYLVRTAEKRDDILVALRQLPKPDLILLDVQLPDANGFDVLVKLRQHPYMQAIPVVMLTGEDTREAVIRGLQAGADGYITKPFEPDMVVQAVKAVLGLVAASPAGAALGSLGGPR